MTSRLLCRIPPLDRVRWGNRSPATFPARLATDHNGTERTMRKVVGLDISLHKTAVCVLDHDRQLV